MLMFAIVLCLFTALAYVILKLEFGLWPLVGGIAWTAAVSRHVTFRGTPIRY